MNRWFFTLSFAVVAALAPSAVLYGQDYDARENRFRAKDRNGDGTISKEESSGNARAFNRHDKDGDGFITREEFGLARRAGEIEADAEDYNEEEKRLMRGDGVASREGEAPAVVISEERCPVKHMRALTSDGKIATAVYRSPPGNGPFPAIIFIHGGFGKWSDNKLKSAVTAGATPTRFLAKGYVIVHSTFRSYINEVQDAGPILDNLAIVDAVKKLEHVDPRSVVVMGGSGGGTISLDLIARTDLCAAVACEPASVVFAGLLEGDASDRQERYKPIYDPEMYYTAEKDRIMRAKIRRFNTPILMVHGDRHPLKRINLGILVPVIKEEKKEIELKIYHNKNHGFYWGRGKDAAEFLDRLTNDIHDFCQKYLKTSPQPLDPSEVRDR